MGVQVNILNLCFRHEDFGLSAKGNFFATSHGKQHDGIGGTVRLLAMQPSLQRDVGNCILSLQAIYKYCNENIEGMHFIYISSENLTLRNTLKERLDTAATIPGTCSYHQFKPLDHEKVKLFFFNFYYLLKTVLHFFLINLTQNNFICGETLSEILFFILDSLFPYNILNKTHILLK